MKERLTTLGAEPVGSSPADAAKFLRDDTKRWSDVIKSAGITLE